MIPALFIQYCFLIIDRNVLCWFVCGKKDMKVDAEFFMSFALKLLKISIVSDLVSIVMVFTTIL